MATKGKELSELGSILSVSANTANIDGSLIVSNSVTIGNSTVNATFTATSINANTVGGNTASDLRSYSDTVAATAYSNAATYAGTAAGTAYSNAATYADNKAANAYSNAIAYSANATNISSGTLTANVLPTSGVTAATYGNSSQIPVITVDATGRITSATTNAVAGVTSFTYTEANNTFAISTGDGSTFAANIGTANATHTGVLKVLDSVANTNTTIAAAVSSVKTAYDAAIAANTNAASAYSNAISYADTVAGTAYTNATSYAATIAGTAYSNGVTYTDNKAANAYSNATTFASNASNISSGTLAEPRLPFRMDQNVRTNDSVSFGSVSITGNLTVTGTTVTINTTNLTVDDNMIYLNEGTGGANANPDLGFAGAYNDGTYRHAGFFRDASDGVWKVFDQYLPEPDASPFIDTANASFRIANFQANVVTAASLSGNGASVTSVDAATVGGNTAGTLRSYSDSVAATAYTNAVSSASSSAATAYSNAVSYFTTNYTASDVLTKIKTVDGTGSGLDADTVDGYDASSFALKTDPEFTNDITTSSGQGRFGGWYAGTGYTGAAFEVGISAGEAYALAYNRGTSSYLNMNFAATDFQFAGESSGFAHINTSFRAPIFYDSGNTSFYIDPASSSNIGSLTTNSGYNLQTSSASSVYTQINATDVAANYAYIQLTTQSGSGYLIRNRTTGNSVTDKSLYLYNESGPIEFVPSANISVRATLSTTGMTIAGSTVWTAANDGSGSGLDADLLDGLSSGSFVQQNGTYTLSSGYTVAMGDWGLRNTTPYGWIQFGPANSSHAHIYTDRTNFYFNVSTLYANGSTMWHAGNDGAGSGLDADLLDGLNASTSATASTIVARDSGGDITGRYFFGVHFNQSSSNSENPTIAAFWTNSGSDNYCRKSTPAHVISQLGLATTSNLASYLPLSGGTMTGDLSFASNWLLYSDTDRDASAAVYYPNSKTRAVRFSFANASSTGTNGNYSGVMHFHPWDGTTASTGDASYQLAFGSSGTNGSGVPILGLRKGIDTTWNSWYYLAAYGVNYKTGALYATQLIDSDSTGYYADPGSTSILNALSVATTTPTDVSLGVNGSIHLATTNYLYMGGSIGAVGGWGTRDWQSGGLRYINCNNLDINNVGYGSSWNFSISTGGIVSSTVQMRAPIFYDSANTSFYVDPASTSVLANVRATSFTNDATGSVRVMFPGGGSYASTSSSVAGAIKIRLPVSWSYTMMRFTVKIYEYTTNEAFEVNCGGYNYGSYWVNTFAYILGNPGTDRNFNVRFGHDGTYCCVYIGETSSSWTYPQVTVTDFEGGYSGYGAAEWDDGWAISFETSFGTISATESNSQIGRVSSIFYDYDNTGYYVNPASGSSLSTITVGNSSRTILIGNQDEGNADYARIRTNSSGSLMMDSRDGQPLYLNWWSTEPNHIISESASRFPTYYDRNSTAYYTDPASTSNINAMTAAGTVRVYNLKFIGEGGNSGNSTESYAIYQEGGAWSHPYPDLRIAYHTGIKMGANPGYEGMRFYTDYDMSTLLLQVNGTSNYIYKYTWMYTTTAGFYSDTNGAHFKPNDTSSYGGWHVQGVRNGWRGIHFYDGGSTPHLMFDGSSNGGIYYETGGRWAQYYHYGNVCQSINTSTSSSSYGLYVSGSIYSTANITAYSDARKKENVVTVDNALDKVNKLRGVFYNKIDDEKKTKQIGVIAQEVKEVLPEVVTHAEDVDEYGVTYGNFAGLFIEAFKEQTKIINDLKQKIEELETKLEKK